jgi:hypothetical protein
MTACAAVGADDVLRRCRGAGSARQRLRRRTHARAPDSARNVDRRAAIEPGSRCGDAAHQRPGRRAVGSAAAEQLAVGAQGQRVLAARGDLRGAGEDHAPAVGLVTQTLRG